MRIRKAGSTLLWARESESVGVGPDSGARPNSPHKRDPGSQAFIVKPSGAGAEPYWNSSPSRPLNFVLSWQ